MVVPLVLLRFFWSSLTRYWDIKDMFGSVKQTTSKGGVEEQIISMYNKLCFFFLISF